MALPNLTFTPQEQAKRLVQELINEGNQVLPEGTEPARVIRALVRAMKAVWQPVAPITTAHMLEAMGAHARELFTTHGTELTRIWADPQHRQSLITLGAGHRPNPLEIHVGPNGEPVFPCRRDLDWHEDGSATLKA